MELARSGVNVDVIENQSCRGSFGLKSFSVSSRTGCICTSGTARCFLNQGTNRYDAIVLDAFLGDSMPTHLFSQEAFQAIAKRLTPQGTLVINSFVNFETGRDFFARTLEATSAQRFSQRQSARWQ